jgi:ADP-ribosylglycohydrolase
MQRVNMNEHEMRNRVLGGLWGSLVGDAMGVPVEFTARTTLRENPVRAMREYGTHDQPRGTWSDDGALILCTVDSLVHSEFDPNDMGKRFVLWLETGLWSAHGKVFDVGIATRRALHEIASGTPIDLAGCCDESSNGNGSLMRILPVALRFASGHVESHVRRLASASAITHRHARSQMACVLYGMVVRELLCGLQPQKALEIARTQFAAWYGDSSEIGHFRHVLEDDFTVISDADINSTGYVLNTLHASLWCLLNTSNFRECVLKAVNLGGDSDTTGCVTGGLAGVLYRVDQIPPEWIDALPRRQDLNGLFGKFVKRCAKAGAEAGHDF